MRKSLIILTILINAKTHYSKMRFARIKTESQAWPNFKNEPIN